jgi:hypothetical protein
MQRASPILRSTRKGRFSFAKDENRHGGIGRGSLRYVFQHPWLQTGASRSGDKQKVALGCMYHLKETERLLARNLDH